MGTVKQINKENFVHIHSRSGEWHFYFFYGKGRSGSEGSWYRYSDYNIGLVQPEKIVFLPVEFLMLRGLE